MFVLFEAAITFASHDYSIFDKSCDLKTKTPKTKAVYISLCWNKSQRVECIQVQNLAHGFVEICIIEKPL